MLPPRPHPTPTSPPDGFGQCCGFPVEGYQNGGQSNGSSGGSAISAEVGAFGEYYVKGGHWGSRRE